MAYMTTQLTASTPKLYIGVDIHKKSWTVHMRTDISDHKTMTIPPSEEVLYQYVEENFPEHEVSMAYEAGCCGFSAARCFLQMGWEVLVVNPSDVPTSDKQYHQKTDRLDCINLSRHLKSGNLFGIYIPDVEQDCLKSLLRQKAELTRRLRSAKNQLKSLLLYHGIQIPAQFDNPNWSKAFIDWLDSLNWVNHAGVVCFESKMQLFKIYRAEEMRLANELRAYCRKHYSKDYYLLKSIPGIGGYLAAAVLAEVGDLRRFNNESQFASYVGIVPNIRNSGGTENVRGITPRCRNLLRSYLIESAWVAYRKDPEMQAYYRKHIGKNPKSIIVKIARKMLNRMLSVIKRETPYQINNKLKTIKG